MAGKGGAVAVDSWLAAQIAVKGGVKMTIDEIRERIEEIKRCHDQKAHELEDKLYEDFIAFVSESQSSELAELAKEVLKTKDLSFSRWYA